MRERNTVNVYHTGEMLSFGCAMTIFSTLTLMQAVYGYPVDESLLLTVKKKKLLLIIYCLKQNEKKHFVVLLWLLYVFYLFLSGNCFCHLQLRFMMFPNGALCGNASYVQ